MRFSLESAVLSCGLAGTIPAVLAPPLWVVLGGLLVNGKGPISSSLDTMILALFTVSFLALTFGVAATLLLGLPTLLIFERFGANTKLAIIGTGALYALVIAVAVGPRSSAFTSPTDLLLHAAFYMILGGTTAAAARYFSLRLGSQ